MDGEVVMAGSEAGMDVRHMEVMGDVARVDMVYIYTEN